MCCGPKSSKVLGKNICVCVHVGESTYEQNICLTTDWTWVYVYMWVKVHMSSIYVWLLIERVCMCEGGDTKSDLSDLLSKQKNGTLTFTKTLKVIFECVDLQLS